MAVRRLCSKWKRWFVNLFDIDNNKTHFSGTSRTRLFWNPAISNLFSCTMQLRNSGVWLTVYRNTPYPANYNPGQKYLGSTDCHVIPWPLNGFSNIRTTLLAKLHLPPSYNVLSAESTCSTVTQHCITGGGGGEREERGRWREWSFTNSALKGKVSHIFWPG